MSLLTENKDILDAIAKILIDKEKITGIEMLDLIK
jgi:ATP-dependent Zn protease